MKNLALAVAFTLGSVCSLGAQSTAVPSDKNQKKDVSPTEQAKRSAEKAEKKLGLNAEQKTKWELAERDHIAANAPLRERMNGSTTPDERKQIQKEIKSNNDLFESTVKTFLTSDQFAKFQQLKKEKQEERKSKKQRE